jgi:tripartite-type tricarboxylate transporter receptor subunit TctC
MDRQSPFCVLVASLLAIAAFSGAPAHSAERGAYPSKPVRMIVPFAPGGGSDIVGRVVAQGLAEQWGETVVVDNRPGAGSTVGAAIASKANPDGYTVMVSSSAISSSPALYKKLSFDITSDFVPVTLIGSQPSLLAVHPSVGAKSVREFIALAKAEPEKFAFASAGVGSATHLGSELFRVKAGVKLVHVPYKSAGLAATALLSGEVQVLMTNMATALPLVKAGRITGLGVTSKERSPLAPELQTVSEAGLTGFEYSTWYGMLVPAGTPKSIVYKLNTDVVKLLSAGRAPRERLTGKGLSIHATTAGDFGRFLKSEVAKWQQVTASAGIKPR